ncbi:adhesion G-protein coupled receptor G7-like [Triplophysa dalaica]|uniref:adhesion G-protein coupled receptor G7-like n=1 Tax=Triplophysa dalaica TaxID=1582913 RepID=UPI0024DF9064|nr:adhesion G-protein coupled receptor G7-like [Triplophysa dalaica]
MSGKDICIFLVFTLAVLEKSWSQNNTVNYTIVTPLQNTTLISSTLQDTTLISSTLQTTTLISSTLQDTTTISSTFQDTTVRSTTHNVAKTSITFQVNSATTLNGTTDLGCQNGVSIHGFCLCSYDWSGSICNIPNFCPEQRPTETNNFTFPKTVLGQFASSTDLCPMETQNAGIPKGSALCNITTRTFDDPNILNCDLTLENVFKTISGASLTEKIRLASSTQILTSKPENLTPQKIENAVKIANILLSAVSSQESMDIAVSTVAVVSQLMNTNHLKFSHIDQEAISELTRTLQKVSVLENLNTFLVQPNLAVQSFKGTSPIQRVQLTLFKGKYTTI